MKRLVRSSLIAAALGALAAMALVMVGLGAKNQGPAFQILAMLFVLLCPPWEIFWAGIGEPNNLRLWASLSMTVAAANALLYVPAGLAHAATAHLRAWARFAAVAAAGVVSLGLGHLCFMP